MSWKWWLVLIVAGYGIYQLYLLLVNVFANIHPPTL
jgi:hypothetical protein